MKVPVTAAVRKSTFPWGRGPDEEGEGEEENEAEQKEPPQKSAGASQEENGMPAPDAIEYGHTCIRLFFSEPKVCLVVDIDKPPPGWEFVGERLDEGWEEEDGEEDPM